MVYVYVINTLILVFALYSLLFFRNTAKQTRNKDTNSDKNSEIE